MTSVEFHPSALVLASGSKDCTVKLFDISKPSVKKAYRSIQVGMFLSYRMRNAVEDIFLTLHVKSCCFFSEILWLSVDNLSLVGRLI